MLALVAVLPLAVPVRALDFTPQETWRALEGVRVPVLMFSDPTGKIRYQPPGNWNFSGSGPTLALYPPDSTGAFMKLLVLGHAPGMAEITALPADDLVKWCQNYLAADAQDVKLVIENPSPFLLNGKPCREFVFEYKSAGQRFQTSVAVLDWNEREHLAVVITALSTDFKTVHDAGTSSLFSWSLRKTENAAGTPAPAAPSSTPAAPGPTPIKAVNR
ncbi:MAG: hypothetical protein ABJF10_12235 [Chthoniobacter sp.]|uniref:hypothetical protein n=1 Tax=Chthoniobacter sp. TaxID=2510640 RepID=UPI0032AABB93